MAPRKTAAERAAEEAAAAEAPTVDPADGADGNQPPEPTVDETPDGADGNQPPEPTVDETPDGADWQNPESDPNAPEPEEETGDADALRFDADRAGAPEPVVRKNWPHAARGNIAGQLLSAATVLGYPLDVVRSTSDGFRYPENIDRYLFPSEYDA